MAKRKSRKTRKPAHRPICRPTSYYRKRGGRLDGSRIRRAASAVSNFVRSAPVQRALKGSKIISKGLAAAANVPQFAAVSPLISTASNMARQRGYGYYLPAGSGMRGRRHMLM